MTIIDRYLLFAFFKILLILFVSFSGLYIVIHLFTNLDEVGDIVEKEGYKVLFTEFYGPQLLDLFNRMTGFLILTSGIFSITMMQRRREMTAIEAAGITKARIVRPIIFASIAVIAVAAVSRELWIPPIKHKLVRTVKNWTDENVVPMSFHKDPRTGILVRGETLDLGDNSISDASVQMPVQMAADITRIEAGIGQIIPSTDKHPAGLLLSDISFPERPGRMPSLRVGEETLIYASRDFPWLKANQALVVSDLDPQQLAYGNLAGQYGSVEEMVDSLKKPNRRFVLQDQVAVHSRLVQPLLDLTLLLLGLPFVIAKSRDNIFMAAATCMLIVVAVQLTTFAGQTMGAYRLITPTALASWLPLLVFLPLTAISLGKLYK